MSAGLSAAIASGLLLASCSRQPVYEDARLSIEPENANFGTIQANDPVAFHTASVMLKNLGKEQLNIESVELPDGFSYDVVPRKSIGEGGDAVLKITLDRRKFSGRVAETAYVLSNDAVQPRMPVALEAEIVGDADAAIEKGGVGPQISFDHRAFNFGSLPRNKTVEHSFNFENLGDKTLKIKYIETGCMCLTARATKYKIPPGGSATIIAKLEPHKYPGQNIARTLDVVTNDRAEPSVPLTVVAQIIDTVRLEPEAIHLPNVVFGRPASAEAKVLQEGSTDLRIRKIETSSPLISVSSSLLDGEVKGYLLEISIAPDMPEGKFDEVVTVFTNYTNYANARRATGPGRELYKNYKKMKLPVKGTVHGSISVTPLTVNFGSVPFGKKLTRKLVVSGAETPFDIESAAIAEPGFDVKWTPIKPGSKYEIILEFIADEPERQIEDKLVIITSGAELAVPVFATVKPGP